MAPTAWSGLVMEPRKAPDPCGAVSGCWSLGSSGGLSFAADTDRNQTSNTQPLPLSFRRNDAQGQVGTKEVCYINMRVDDNALQ